MNMDPQWDGFEDTEDHSFYILLEFYFNPLENCANYAPGLHPIKSEHPVESSNANQEHSLEVFSETNQKSKVTWWSLVENVLPPSLVAPLGPETPCRTAEYTRRRGGSLSPVREPQNNRARRDGRSRISHPYSRTDAKGLGACWSSTCRRSDTQSPIKFYRLILTN